MPWSWAEEEILLVVNYNGSAEKAEAVKQEIEAAGEKPAPCSATCPTTEPAEAFMKDIIKEYKRIDILVNNAGVTRDGPADADEGGGLRRGGGHQPEGRLPHYPLRRQTDAEAEKRRIINLSSVVGLRGNGGQVNYSASKAGIIGLTKSAAKELASRGITVNAIAPGFYRDGDDSGAAGGDQGGHLKGDPLQKFGKPEDVAQAAAFLASEEAAYITGQVLCVDGGMAM